MDHLAANTQAHHTHNIYSIHSIQFISIPIPFNSAGISSLSFQLAVSFAYIRTKRSVPSKLIHNTHSTGLPLQTKHKNNCIENADINIQDTHAHTHTQYITATKLILAMVNTANRRKKNEKKTFRLLSLVRSVSVVKHAVIIEQL